MWIISITYSKERKKKENKKENYAVELYENF